MADWLDRLKAFAGKEQLACGSGTNLLTVSGGVDSVVMAHLFKQAGWSFAIAHCNFGLRGAESDGDEQFVARLAEQYKVAFFAKRFDTTEYLTAHKVSIQMAARELRYAWFREVAMQQNFRAIATAHHQTDLVETMLINLIRGTGIAGLHGILAKKDSIIRPLLCFTKEEILEYAREQDLPYREDSSNLSDGYLRNQVRHHVIPAIKAINPQLESTMNANATRFRAWEGLALAQAEQLKTKYTGEKEGRFYILLDRLKAEPWANILCYYFLSPMGFNEEQAAAMLLEKGTDSGRVFYSSTHKAVCNRGELIITADAGKLPHRPVEVPLQEGTIPIGEHKLLIKKYTKPENFEVHTSKNFAYCDADKLRDTVQLRKWRQGDVFYPLGMEQRKKLSDFFTDIKLSALDKEDLWLLVCGDDIVWIAPYRMDNRFKITENTREMIIFEWL